ncbi:hypothetical protein LGK95_08665, partial [Clostridium algoriphilum]|uniref:cohesin domain-containing protein n=1 Tax=Clostridium algoriphilum TaxID=198347 RepID=UPI0021F44BDC
MKFKKTSYFMISFLLLTFILILGSMKVSATTVPRIYYSVDNTSIKVGDTFNIYVNCENISDLYGASVDFKYDASMLQILDITEGDVFKNSGKTYNPLVKSTMPNTTGTVSIGLALQGDVAGFNGTGKLFVIKAKALKLGTVSLKTTSDSSQLGTNGLNMCVKLADATTGGKISGVTYEDKSVIINTAILRDSLITSHTVPASMIPGKTYNVSISVKNTGSETWTAAKKYKFAFLGTNDPFYNYRLALSSTDNILPGQNKTFTFAMKAPPTEGTYISDWQMAQEGVGWFGTKFIKP